MNDRLSDNDRQVLESLTHDDLFALASKSSDVKSRQMDILQRVHEKKPEGFFVSNVPLFLQEVTKRIEEVVRSN